MRVLLLGIDMEGLHGSFMHILEYAQYFTSRGDEVVVGTIFLAEENKKLLEEAGAKVCRMDKLPNLEYDLIYALHLILFPALLNTGIRYRKSILMTLSKSEGVEGLPPSPLWPQYDMLAAISPEIIEIYEKSFRIPPKLLQHVPNHIPLPFLKKANLKQIWAPEP